MKKVYLVRSLVTLLVLFGCSGEDSGVITLKVIDAIDATSPAYSTFMENRAHFNALYEGEITVVYEDLTNEPFHEKVQTYVAANRLPDIIYMFPSGRSAILHDRGLVKDLRPLLGDEFLSSFTETALNTSLQRGGYLAIIPKTVTASHVMYVNTALLAELGLSPAETYEELLTQVPVIRGAGLEVVLMANKDAWVMQSVLYSAIVGRVVGNEFIDAIIRGERQFTDPEFVETLSFVQELYDKQVISRATLQTGYGEAPGLFAQKRAAYYIDGDWRTEFFLTDPNTGEGLISLKEQETIELTVFPTIPGERPKAPKSSTILGEGYGVNAKIPAGSEREQAAVEFIKYMAGREVQLSMLESRGVFPSRTDVSSDRLEPLAVKRGEFYRKYSGSYVLDGIFAPDVATVINIGLQELALGLATPEEIAQRMQKAHQESEQ